VRADTVFVYFVVDVLYLFSSLLLSFGHSLSISLFSFCINVVVLSFGKFPDFVNSEVSTLRLVSFLCCR
jgi:hypothetical protein